MITDSPVVPIVTSDSFGECTVLEAIMVFKVLDADGDVAIVTGCSEGLRTWEALGMLITTADDLRSQLSGRAETD